MLKFSSDVSILGKGKMRSSQLELNRINVGKGNIYKKFQS